MPVLMTIEILSVEETDYRQHKTDVIHQQQKYNNHNQYYHFLYWYVDRACWPDWSAYARQPARGPTM